MKLFLTRWLPALAWMALIFLFSHQSGSGSGKLTAQILAFLQQYLPIEGVSPQTAGFVLRKSAHMFVYFMLMIWMYRLSAYYIKEIPSLWFSWIWVVIYAVLDEWHQTWVPGRSGEFRDVLIDAAGGGIACLMIWLLNKKR